MPQVITPATIAQTNADAAILRGRLNVLTNQMRVIEDQRNRLARQLSQVDAAARTGVIGRLDILDKELARLDGDLSQVRQQMAQSPTPVFAGTSPPSGAPPFRNRDPAPAIISAMLILFVLFPVTLAVVRRLWKRQTPMDMPRGWAETPQRLERLEHAVDTIAIEVERISESQRFMTRLMTETQLGPAVAAVRASADAARNVAAQPSEANNLKALGAGDQPFEPIRINEREGVEVRGDR